MRNFRPDAPEETAPSGNVAGRLLGSAAFGLSVGLSRGLKGVGWLVQKGLEVVTAIPLMLFHRVFDQIAVVYERTLATVLKAPVLAIGAAIALLAVTVNLYPQLGKELVPELIQGEFYVDAELPPGTQPT